MTIWWRCWHHPECAFSLQFAVWLREAHHKKIVFQHGGGGGLYYQRPKAPFWPSKNVKLLATLPWPRWWVMPLLTWSATAV